MKVKDPLGSRPEAVDVRGAYVAFGSTEPGARLEVPGLAQRGQLGDSPFKRLTGEGYVAPVSAPYDRARCEGAEVVPLLFETFSWARGDRARWRCCTRRSRHEATSCAARSTTRLRGQPKVPSACIQHDMNMT